MSSQLDRFRKVALNHRIPVDDVDGMPPIKALNLLRGRLNARVLPSCAEPLRPFWVSNPPSSGLLVNDSYRNWAVIGGVGSRHYGIIDKTGTVRACSECGSIDVWASHDGSLIRSDSTVDESPGSVHLTSPEDQVYEWSVTLGPIEFTRLIYFVHSNGHEAIYNEIRVRNLSLEEQAFEFAVVVKPLSILGMEPIESLELVTETQTLYANGFLACLMDSQPTNVIMTSCESSDVENVFKLDVHNRSLTSAKGLATAILCYKLKLQPAHSNSFFFVSPLTAISKSEPVPEFVMNSSVIDHTVDEWFSFAGRKLIGQYPEQTIGDVLAQAKATLVIKAYDSLLGTPLPTSILGSIELARVIDALTLSGCKMVIDKLYMELEHALMDQFKKDSVALFPILYSVFFHFKHVITENSNSQLTSLADHVLSTVLSAAYSYCFEPALETAQESEPATEATPATPKRSDDAQSVYDKVSEVLGSNKWASLFTPDRSYEALTDTFFLRVIRE